MYKNGKNCEGQCLGCKTLSYPKRKMSHYLNGVVGVSQFTLNRHLAQGYFPKAKKEVIYTSVAPQVHELPYQRNNYITFGYIGRIHPTKGVTALVQAFNQIDRSQALQLVIAGDGDEDYLQACKAAAAGNAQIEFLGKVAAHDFYRAVDVVLISSAWHEPFPRVLVEAYAYGRPVLATPSGGTAEMIVEGQTGFVYPLGHPSD
ncbi:MAG: glycosyltransferase family 4 protein [Bacteroidia bacterium]|nr:glycosyltransferase family 4 protein [Bacteroidia bacterium]